MSGVYLAAAGIGAATTYYGAEQQKSAAEKAAQGSQATPWGNTAGYLEALLDDAFQQFNYGNFQFGPDPNVYNSYLDWGGNRLGLDVGGLQRIDPNAGYGPEAYSWMIDLMGGVPGSGRTNPQALMGVQDPWAAGLMGGLYGYGSAGGFDRGGQQGISTAPSSLQISAVDPGYVPSYYDWTQTPTYVPSWGQSIPGVPAPGGGS